MAGLKQRMQQEITASLKSGDKVRLGTLRLLSAAAKNRELSTRGSLNSGRW